MLLEVREVVIWMCVCVCVCVCVSGKVHGKKKNKGFFWSPGNVLV